MFVKFTAEQNHIVSQLFGGNLSGPLISGSTVETLFAAVRECSSCVRAVIVLYTVGSINTRVFCVWRKTHGCLLRGRTGELSVGEHAAPYKRM